MGASSRPSLHARPVTARLLTTGGGPRRRSKALRDHTALPPPGGIPRSESKDSRGCRHPAVRVQGLPGLPSLAAARGVEPEDSPAALVAPPPVVCQCTRQRAAVRTLSGRPSSHTRPAALGGRLPTPPAGVAAPAPPCSLLLRQRLDAQGSWPRADPPPSLVASGRSRYSPSQPARPALPSRWSSMGLPSFCHLGCGPLLPRRRAGGSVGLLPTKQKPCRGRPPLGGGARDGGKMKLS